MKINKILFFMLILATNSYIKSNDDGRKIKRNFQDVDYAFEGIVGMNSQDLINFPIEDFVKLVNKYLPNKEGFDKLKDVFLLREYSNEELAAMLSVTLAIIKITQEKYRIDSIALKELEALDIGGRFGALELTKKQLSVK